MKDIERLRYLTQEGIGRRDSLVKQGIFFKIFDDP